MRPLCADYWADRSTSAVPSIDGEWFDVEGKVASQHGAKSWIVEPAARRGPILVERLHRPTSSRSAVLSRLLGVRRVVDPDDPDALIAATGGSTEIFGTD